LRAVGVDKVIVGTAITGACASRLSCLRGNFDGMGIFSTSRRSVSLCDKIAQVRQELHDGISNKTWPLVLLFSRSVNMMARRIPINAPRHASVIESRLNVRRPWTNQQKSRVRHNHRPEDHCRKGLSRVRVCSRVLKHLFQERIRALFSG